MREAAQGLCAQREVFPVLVREDGAYAERVELRLSACADLRVSCLGEEQEPRFGIRLRLTDAEGGVQERRTDGTGAAAFRALEAGAYTLTEQGPDGLIRQYAVTVDSWGLVRVDGVPTRTLRLRRPGPGGVEVRVRGEDGRPLPGVRVTAASDGGPLGEQVTDAWGAVVFHTLPTDGCTLTALPPAGFQAPKAAVFTEDRTAWQAEITLAPLDGTAYVDGHIVWEDFDNAYRSRPLGMTLNLYCNGALCRQQMVSTAGAEYYRFSGLPCTDPDGEDFQYDVRQAFDMPGYRAQTRPGLLYNRLQTASVRVSYTDGFTMLDLAGQDAYTVYRGAPLSVRFKPVYGYEPVPPLVLFAGACHRNGGGYVFLSCGKRSGLIPQNNKEGRCPSFFYAGFGKCGFRISDARGKHWSRAKTRPGRAQGVAGAGTTGRRREPGGGNRLAAGTGWLRADAGARRGCKRPRIGRGARRGNTIPPARSLQKPNGRTRGRAARNEAGGGAARGPASDGAHGEARNLRRVRNTGEARRISRQARAPRRTAEQPGPDAKRRAELRAARRVPKRPFAWRKKGWKTGVQTRGRKRGTCRRKKRRPGTRSRNAAADGQIWQGARMAGRKPAARGCFGGMDGG